MAMDRMMRVGMLVVLLSAAVGSSGCEHMNNTEKGAGIGGAGAGAGLAVGAATGNPRTGAAVGGLLVQAPALVGNDVDRQEKRDRDIQQAVATADAQAQQQRMGMTDVSISHSRVTTIRSSSTRSAVGQHIPASPPPTSTT